MQIKKNTFKHLLIKLFQIIWRSGSQKHHIIVTMKTSHFIKRRRERSLKITYFKY